MTGARPIGLGVMLLLPLLAPVLPAAHAEEPAMPANPAALPQTVEGWSLAGPARTVTPAAIFDYMDGAGELYLGYRFQHLDVSEYKKPGADDILVELYWMETSDDAWGLLSGDWGGERVNLTATSAGEPPGEIRALYGAGLLRLCSGNLFARVLSYQETAASREAVLAIGRALVAGRPQSAEPRLAQALPQHVGSTFHLRADRLVFLRSHLVLNSVYFLSQENSLDLGFQVEMAASTYVADPQNGAATTVRMLLARYPTEAAARDALTHFDRVYFAAKPIPSGDRGTARIEDGWFGFVRSGRGLGLIFEAPDEASTRLFLENAKQALDSTEVRGE